MKLSEIKEYHKNPRKISEERFGHLSESLRKLGDLGGVVVNRPTKEIIGGNQRIKAFMQERDKYEVLLLEEYKTKQADGTVARGYVIRDKGLPSEQRFSYREVEWTPDECEEANIVANKVTGMWDYDMLANGFDVAKLLDFGFSEQELDLLPKPPEVEMDKEGLTKSLDSYLEGNIKQIVLYFKSEDFDGVVARFDNLMAYYKVDNHTEAILRMLEDWEKGHPDRDEYEDTDSQEEGA